MVVIRNNNHNPITEMMAILFINNNMKPIYGSFLLSSINFCQIKNISISFLPKVVDLKFLTIHYPLNYSKVIAQTPIIINTLNDLFYSMI